MKETPAASASNRTREWIEREIRNGGDATNPAFLFSGTSKALLLAIANGMIDPVQIAKATLARRGRDADGDWVGFHDAAKVHGVTFHCNKLVNFK